MLSTVENNTQVFKESLKINRVPEMCFFLVGDDLKIVDRRLGSLSSKRWINIRHRHCYFPYCHLVALAFPLLS